jgi:uncharacterized membrane protein
MMMTHEAKYSNRNRLTIPKTEGKTTNEQFEMLQDNTYMRTLPSIDTIRQYSILAGVFFDNAISIHIPMLYRPMTFMT